MPVSSVGGVADPARRAAAAVILLVCLLIAAPAASRASATVATPQASAAAPAVQLEAVDRTRANLRAAIRRSCAGRSTARCAGRRARLRTADARAARLRAVLRRLPSTRPATSKSPAPAPSPAPPAAPVPSTGTSGDPAAPAAGAPVSFQPGVVVWHDVNYDVAAAQRLGAKRVRMEYPIGTPVSEIAPVVGNWAAHGIQVVLLAGFNMTVPTADEARNLGEWARTLGPGGSYWSGRADGAHAVALIEFGNETSMTWQYHDSFDSSSYAQRAQTYGLRFRDAAQAIEAANPNVGLLAQADDYSGRWMDGIYAAVPDFHDYVSGWITHPYGSDWRDTIRRDEESLARHGAPASIPWDATEWGLSTDNGRCVQDDFGWDPCMSYATAAQTMHQTIEDLRAALGGRLRTLMFYRVRDLQDPGATSEREDYFGLQTLDLHDKGAYTAQARIELAAR